MFTYEDLHQVTFSVYLERRLIRYLQIFRTALTQLYYDRNSLSRRLRNFGQSIFGFTPTVKQIDRPPPLPVDCVLKGMGLIVAVQERRSSFYIYFLQPQHSHLLRIHHQHFDSEHADIAVFIRGPHGDYGEVIIQHLSPCKSSTYKSLNFSATKSACNIPINYRLTARYIRINYMPQNPGTHELAILRRGYHLPGSPFLVTVDMRNQYATPQTYAFSDDEECSKNKANRRRLKVMFRVVDFVTEKMLLTEDGRLEKLPVLVSERILAYRTSQTSSERTCSSPDSIDSGDEQIRRLKDHEQPSKTSPTKKPKIGKDYKNLLRGRWRKVMLLCRFFAKQSSDHRRLQILRAAGHIFDGRPVRLTESTLKLIEEAVSAIPNEKEEITCQTPIDEISNGSSTFESDVNIETGSSQHETCNTFTNNGKEICNETSKPEVSSLEASSGALEMSKTPNSENTTQDQSMEGLRELYKSKSNVGLNLITHLEDEKDKGAITTRRIAYSQYRKDAALIIGKVAATELEEMKTAVPIIDSISDEYICGGQSSNTARNEQTNETLNKMDSAKYLSIKTEKQSLQDANDKSNTISQIPDVTQVTNKEVDLTIYALELELNMFSSKGRGDSKVSEHLENTKHVAQPQSKSREKEGTGNLASICYEYNAYDFDQLYTEISQQDKDSRSETLSSTDITKHRLTPDREHSPQCRDSNAALESISDAKTREFYICKDIALPLSEFPNENMNETNIEERCHVVPNNETKECVTERDINTPKEKESVLQKHPKIQTECPSAAVQAMILKFENLQKVTSRDLAKEQADMDIASQALSVDNKELQDTLSNEGKIPGGEDDVKTKENKKPPIKTTKDVHQSNTQAVDQQFEKQTGNATPPDLEKKTTKKQKDKSNSAYLNAIENEETENETLKCNFPAQLTANISCKGTGEARYKVLEDSQLGHDQHSERQEKRCKAVLAESGNAALSSSSNEYAPDYNSVRNATTFSEGHAVPTSSLNGGDKSPGNEIQLSQEKVESHDSLKHTPVTNVIEDKSEHQNDGHLLERALEQLSTKTPNNFLINISNTIPSPLLCNLPEANTSERQFQPNDLGIASPPHLASVTKKSSEVLKELDAETSASSAAKTLKRDLVIQKTEMGNISVTEEMLKAYTQDKEVISLSSRSAPMAQILKCIQETDSESSKSTHSNEDLEENLTLLIGSSATITDDLKDGVQTLKEESLTHPMKPFTKLTESKTLLRRVNNEPISIGTENHLMPRQIENNICLSRPAKAAREVLDLKESLHTPASQVTEDQNELCTESLEPTSELNRNRVEPLDCTPRSRQTKIVELKLATDEVDKSLVQTSAIPNAEEEQENASSLLSLYAANQQSIAHVNIPHSQFSTSVFTVDVPEITEKFPQVSTLVPLFTESDTFTLSSELANVKHGETSFPTNEETVAALKDSDLAHCTQISSTGVKGNLEEDAFEASMYSTTDIIKENESFSSTSSILPNNSAVENIPDITTVPYVRNIQDLLPVQETMFSSAVGNSSIFCKGSVSDPKQCVCIDSCKESKLVLKEKDCNATIPTTTDNVVHQIPSVAAEFISSVSLIATDDEQAAIILNKLNATTQFSTTTFEKEEKHVLLDHENSASILSDLTLTEENDLPLYETNPESSLSEIVPVQDDKIYIEPLIWTSAFTVNDNSVVSENAFATVVEESQAVLSVMEIETSTPLSVTLVEQSPLTLDANIDISTSTTAINAKTNAVVENDDILFLKDTSTFKDIEAVVGTEGLDLKGETKITPVFLPFGMAEENGVFLKEMEAGHSIPTCIDVKEKGIAEEKINIDSLISAEPDVGDEVLKSAYTDPFVTACSNNVEESGNDDSLSLFFDAIEAPSKDLGTVIETSETPIFYKEESITTLAGEESQISPKEMCMWRPSSAADDKVEETAHKEDSLFVSREERSLLINKMDNESLTRLTRPCVQEGAAVEKKAATELGEISALKQAKDTAVEVYPTQPVPLTRNLLTYNFTNNIDENSGINRESHNCEPSPPTDSVEQSEMVFGETYFEDSVLILQENINIAKETSSVLGDILQIDVHNNAVEEKASTLSEANIEVSRDLFSDYAEHPNAPSEATRSHSSSSADVDKNVDTDDSGQDLLDRQIHNAKDISDRASQAERFESQNEVYFRSCRDASQDRQRVKKVSVDPRESNNPSKLGQTPDIIASEHSIALVSDTKFEANLKSKFNSDDFGSRRSDEQPKSSEFSLNDEIHKYELVDVMRLSDDDNLKDFSSAILATCNTPDTVSSMHSPLDFRCPEETNKCADSLYFLQDVNLSSSTACLENAMIAQEITLEPYATLHQSSEYEEEIGTAKDEARHRNVTDPFEKHTPKPAPNPEDKLAYNPWTTPLICSAAGYAPIPRKELEVIEEQIAYNPWSTAVVDEKHILGFENQICDSIRTPLLNDIHNISFTVQCQESCNQVLETESLISGAHLEILTATDNAVAENIYKGSAVRAEDINIQPYGSRTCNTISSEALEENNNVVCKEQHCWLSPSTTIQTAIETASKIGKTEYEVQNAAPEDCYKMKPGEESGYTSELLVFSSTPEEFFNQEFIRDSDELHYKQQSKDSIFLYEGNLGENKSVEYNTSRSDHKFQGTGSDKDKSNNVLFSESLAKENKDGTQKIHTDVFSLDEASTEEPVQGIDSKVELDLPDTKTQDQGASTNNSFEQGASAGKLARNCSEGDCLITGKVLENIPKINSNSKAKRRAYFDEEQTSNGNNTSAEFFIGVNEPYVKQNPEISAEGCLEPIRNVSDTPEKTSHDTQKCFTEEDVLGMEFSTNLDEHINGIIPHKDQAASVIATEAFSCDRDNLVKGNVLSLPVSTSKASLGTNIPPIGNGKIDKDCSGDKLPPFKDVKIIVIPPSPITYFVSPPINEDLMGNMVDRPSESENSTKKASKYNVNNSIEKHCTTQQARCLKESQYWTNCEQQNKEDKFSSLSELTTSGDQMAPEFVESISGVISSEFSNSESDGTTIAGTPEDGHGCECTKDFLENNDVLVKFDPSNEITNLSCSENSIPSNINILDLLTSKTIINTVSARHDTTKHTECKNTAVNENAQSGKPKFETDINLNEAQKESKTSKSPVFPEGNISETQDHHSSSQEATENEFSQESGATFEGIPKTEQFDISTEGVSNQEYSDTEISCGTRSEESAQAHISSVQHEWIDAPYLTFRESLSVLDNRYTSKHSNAHNVQSQDLEMQNCVDTEPKNRDQSNSETFSAIGEVVVVPSSRTPEELRLLDATLVDIENSAGFCNELSSCEAVLEQENEYLEFSRDNLQSENEIFKHEDLNSNLTFLPQSRSSVLEFNNPLILSNSLTATSENDNELDLTSFEACGSSSEEVHAACFVEGAIACAILDPQPCNSVFASRCPLLAPEDGPVLASSPSQYNVERGTSFFPDLDDLLSKNFTTYMSSSGDQFHLWPSDVAFGSPSSNLDENIDFDSVLAAPNLEEALRKLEYDIQKRKEEHASDLTNEEKSEGEIPDDKSLSADVENEDLSSSPSIPWNGDDNNLVEEVNMEEEEENLPDQANGPAEEENLSYDIGDSDYVSLDDIQSSFKHSPESRDTDDSRNDSSYSAGQREGEQEATASCSRYRKLRSFEYSQEEQEIRHMQGGSNAVISGFMGPAEREIWGILDSNGDDKDKPRECVVTLEVTDSDSVSTEKQGISEVDVRYDKYDQDGDENEQESEIDWAVALSNVRCYPRVLSPGSGPSMSAIVEENEEDSSITHTLSLQLSNKQVCIVKKGSDGDMTDTVSETREDVLFSLHTDSQEARESVIVPEVITHSNGEVSCTKEYDEARAGTSNEEALQHAMIEGKDCIKLMTADIINENCNVKTDLNNVNSMCLASPYQMSEMQNETFNNIDNVETPADISQCVLSNTLEVHDKQTLTVNKCNPDNEMHRNISKCGEITSDNEYAFHSNNVVNNKNNNDADFSDPLPVHATKPKVQALKSLFEKNCSRVSSNEERNESRVLVNSTPFETDATKTKDDCSGRGTTSLNSENKISISDSLISPKIVLHSIKGPETFSGSTAQFEDETKTKCSFDHTEHLSSGRVKQMYEQHLETPLISSYTNLKPDRTTLENTTYVAQPISFENEAETCSAEAAFSIAGMIDTDLKVSVGGRKELQPEAYSQESSVSASEVCDGVLHTDRQMACKATRDSQSSSSKGAVGTTAETFTQDDVSTEKFANTVDEIFSEILELDVKDSLDSTEDPHDMHAESLNLTVGVNNRYTNYADHISTDDRQAISEVSADMNASIIPRQPIITVTEPTNETLDDATQLEGVTDNVSETKLSLATCIARRRQYWDDILRLAIEQKEIEDKGNGTPQGTQKSPGLTHSEIYRKLCRRSKFAALRSRKPISVRVHGIVNKWRLAFETLKFLEETGDQSAKQTERQTGSNIVEQWKKYWDNLVEEQAQIARYKELSKEEITKQYKAGEKRTLHVSGIVAVGRERFEKISSETVEKKYKDSVRKRRPRRLERNINSASPSPERSSRANQNVNVQPDSKPFTMPGSPENANTGETTLFQFNQNITPDMRLSPEQVPSPLGTREEPAKTTKNSSSDSLTFKATITQFEEEEEEDSDLPAEGILEVPDKPSTTVSVSKGSLADPIKLKEESNEHSSTLSPEREDNSTAEKNKIEKDPETKNRFKKAKQFFQMLEQNNGNSKDSNPAPRHRTTGYRKGKTSIPPSNSREVWGSTLSLVEPQTNRHNAEFPDVRPSSVSSAPAYETWGSIQSLEDKEVYDNKANKDGLRSSPSSSTESLSRCLPFKKFRSTIGGSERCAKVYEKFHVEDLFKDVVGEYGRNCGSLKGIPHKQAVLASLQSVGDRCLSPYDEVGSAATSDDEQPYERSMATSPLPQGYLPEYPYLSTTPARLYRPRSSLVGSSLISRKDLLSVDQTKKF